VTPQPHAVEPVPVRLGPDDLGDLFDFLVVCDTAVVGQADISEEEVAADLRNPAVESYGWRDASGRLVAHGYVERVADSEKVVVDVYVRYLREKLDRPFGRSSFETVRGVGYRLREDAP